MTHPSLNYHPAVQFVYFALVIGCSACLMHPAFLLISLLGAIGLSVKLSGGRETRLRLRYMLALMLVTALINPAFNHEGVTILTYLPNGNPLTLESIIYGMAAACMLVSVLGWFACFETVMTSEKLTYLFGRVIPSLSLVFSMVLRFVPRFRTQLRLISDAQRCVGRDVASGSVVKRLRHGMTILSILITWSLESAVETADSMKSRGYGQPGRTAFSIFTFDSRDKRALAAIVLTGGYTILGAVTGGSYFRYFPSVRFVALTPYAISVCLAYLLLCGMPLIAAVWEDYTWKAIK